MNEPLFTLCAAAAAGVILIGASARLKIPSIALLLVGGVLLGPEALGVIEPTSLGSGFKLVVGMAVAIILFEGGLTLDLEGARKSPVVIGRMLTIGVLITWSGATLTVWSLFDVTFSIAALCGTLVVVTGPTVVAPILRRINVRDRIRHILYWESVLIDAIGVFLAVLCFEWISPDADHGTWSPLARFALRVGVGAGIGAGVGLVMAKVLRSHWIQDEHVNIFVLAIALFTFAACETILHESGVLAVIVAGFCLGLGRSQQLKRVKRFKLELTELGVGTLFVLLAGTLELAQFRELGWALVAAVAILTLVIRPVAIAVSTWGRGYSLQEKIFLSWVAPRGIVAAFLASLFALELGANEAFQAEARLLHTFTFAVIGATVIVQGLSAPAVAKLLRVQKEPPRTWLIVGETKLAEPLADTLNDVGIPAICLCEQHVGGQQRDSSRVIHSDPLDRALFDDARFADVAAVVAVSPNVYFNELVCQRWAEVVGKERCYHWSDSLAPDGPGTRRFVGSPIWAYANTPTALTTQLESGAVAFGKVSITDGSQSSLGKHLSPLFRVRGGLTSVVGALAGQQWSVGDEIIVARKRVMGLAKMVGDAVVIEDAEPDFDSVVRQLLERAKAAEPSLPVDDLHRLIIEREQSMSTAMGAGVAIPHAYHDVVARPQCYVGSVKSGIRGDTPDGEPIRLVFLVLSPSGQAEAHLKSLASIANLCSDAEYLSLLQAQETGEQLLQRIRERE